MDQNLVDLRDAFFNELVDRAVNDTSVYILTCDHGAFGLNRFIEICPERFLNLGIAEQNMVSLAAGLSSLGNKVFIYGISPFVSLRVAEQLAVDVASMKFDVNVIAVGAGFTYATDGPTHHGLCDTGVISAIPGIKIFNCSSPATSRLAVTKAFESSCPSYIRIEKEKVFDDRLSEIDQKNGFRLMNDVADPDIMVVTTGILWAEVLRNRDRISEEIRSWSCLDIFDFSAFDRDSFVSVIRRAKFLVVYDEGYESGLYSLVAKIVLGYELNIKVRKCVVPDKYIFKYGDREYLREESAVGITNLIAVLGSCR